MDHKLIEKITTGMIYRYEVAGHYLDKPILGDKGKIFLKEKNGYLNSYIVPILWEKPFGFKSVSGNSYYETYSELHAMNYYRHSRSVDKELEGRWDKEIEKQDYLYELSKSITSDVILPDNIKEEFIPRPHQLVGIKYQEACGGNFLIADGMRSGKTFSALILSAKKGFDKCLIICPAMLQEVWRKAIDQLFITSTVKTLESNDVLENGYNIISYDKLHTIKDLNCDIVIADEVHYILTKDARRSTAMSNINAKFKLALSGTVILNTPYEIISVLNWLDEELADEFTEYLDSINCDIYNTAKSLAIELRKRCMLSRDMTQISPDNTTHTNLIKIKCNLPEEASLQQIAEYKIPYVINYVNTYVKEKIIVAVQHLNTAKKLCISLGDQAVVITGETPDKARKQIQEAFSKGARILIGSSAISEGIDLSFSSRLILTESSYSFRTEQLRARCNRVGKSEHISVDLLVTDHPKDINVMNILEKKYEMNYGFNDG